MRNPLPFKSGGVEVGTSWTTLKTLTNLKDAYQFLRCEVASAATGSTLSDFRLRTKSHRDAAYAVSEYAADSVGPATLPVSTTAVITAAINGPAAVQLQAKAVASSPTVTVRGRLFNA
jgi:hypothetical protein